MSPILGTIEGLRFYFYLADLRERPHVHVGEGKGISSSDAKIWLDTLTVAARGRFNQRQLNKALRVAREHQEQWLSIWRSYEERS
jgi:hypothetical protein